MADEDDKTPDTELTPPPPDPAEVAPLAPTPRESLAEFKVTMTPLDPLQVAAIEAHRKRPLPKAEAFIRSTGLSDADKATWLDELRQTDMSDDEIVAALAPDPASAPLQGTWSQRFKRRARIVGYELQRLWKQEPVILRLIYVACWMYLLIVPVMKLALSDHATRSSIVGAVISAVVIVSTKGWSFFTELRPKHMQVLKRNYDERKLALQRLLDAQQSWYSERPNARERFMFQHDALKLIASYVRDHRYDARRSIFVNLLVCDEEHVWVINRDNLGSRKVPQQYTHDQCALASRALETGAAQMTGDVYVEFPNTVPGKKYVSILALPVKLGVKTLGVVSIDSEGKHHFDSYFEELQTALAPYVQLLALAMIKDHDSVAEGEVERE